MVFTPDGKRAMAAKFPGHKLALLEVNGEKVTYTKQDMPVGLWPYNFDITPDGKLALTADNGASGRSDGNVDTVTVIDLEANPPRVIDKVVVGDAPEGFAISPTGKLAVALLLNGNDAAKNAWFYNRNGKVVALQDRRQEGDAQQRGRGARPAGRRGVQQRRPLHLRRQLSWTATSRSCASTATRSSTPASRCAARPAGIDARPHALARRVTIATQSCPSPFLPPRGRHGHPI